MIFHKCLQLCWTFYLLLVAVKSAFAYQYGVANTDSLANLVTSSLTRCQSDGSRRKQIFNRFLSAQLGNTEGATIGSILNLENKETCLLYCFDTDGCTAVEATAPVGGGIDCIPYAVDVRFPLPTSSSANTTLYIQEWDHCKNHNCSLVHGLPCVDGLNDYSCTCQSGFGWDNIGDKFCNYVIPYFFADFENGLDNLFWEYGQRRFVHGEPWGKAVELSEGGQITIKDSNQYPGWNSDKCPWSIANCSYIGSGMSMSILTKLSDRNTTDEKPIVYSSYGSSLYVSTTGKPTARVYKKNQWVWEASSTTDVQYGSWTHWMLTWSNSAGVKLYLNGIQVAEDEMGQATTFGITNTVSVGAYQGKYINGMLDNLAVWTTELSAEDVKGLYESYFH